MVQAFKELLIEQPGSVDHSEDTDPVAVHSVDDAICPKTEVPPGTVNRIGFGDHFIAQRQV